MEVHVAGVPVSADGFPLAVTAPQQCQLAWLPSELSAVVAGQPAFALLETRDAAGNRLAHVRADTARHPTLSVAICIIGFGLAAKGLHCLLSGQHRNVSSATACLVTTAFYAAANVKERVEHG